MNTTLPTSSTTAPLHFTKHAQKRAAQRGISPAMVDFAMQYGHCISKQGLNFFVLRRKDLPSNLSAKRKERLEGLVVVAAHSMHTGWKVYTVYRNSEALKAIRKKLNYLSVPDEVIYDRSVGYN